LLSDICTEQQNIICFLKEKTHPSERKCLALCLLWQIVTCLKQKP
jgi:hypothetical protein